MSTLRMLTLGLCLSTAGCDGWSEGQVIDSLPFATGHRPPYFGPRIVTAYGHASLIYTHRFTQLKASRYGLPWTTPEAVGPHTSYHHAHALAVGGDGATTTLFISAGAMSWSRFVSGAWSAPAILDSSGGRPGTAADATGNVLGVWVNANTVRASRFVVGSGWSKVESLNQDALEIRSLHVAVSPSGVGVAAWCEERSDGAYIVADRFEPASGWSGSAALASLPFCAGSAPTYDFLQDRSTVVVGISDAGVPSVLWTDGNIKVRRQTLAPSPTWASTVSLTSAGHAVNPRLAVNGGNDALVVWQTDAPGDVRLLGRRFTSSSGSWGATSIVSPHAPLRSPELALTIDDAGRGMVAFIEGGVAKAVRYDGAAFLAAETLGTTGDYELDLTMTRGGTAYLLRDWAQRDLLVHQFNP